MGHRPGTSTMNVLIIIALLAVRVAATGRGYGYGYRPMRYGYGDPYNRRPYYRDDVEDSSEDVEEDTRVYRFHINEESYGAYQYHAEDGQAAGFSIDLMNAICERAGKECYTIMDKAKHCWYYENEHEYPGMGLLAGWYAGCLGMFATVERENSFTFSKAFTQNTKVALYYQPGAGLMDPEHDHELANHTIGFVEGWTTDPVCLDHQADFHGNHMGEYTPVIYKAYRAMVKAVLNKEVDAVLAPRALDLDKKGLAHTEPCFECSTQGASLMARYGDDVLEWWDKAFEEMKDEGEYRRLCMSAERKHGGKIACV